MQRKIVFPLAKRNMNAIGIPDRDDATRDGE